MSLSGLFSISILNSSLSQFFCNLFFSLMRNLCTAVLNLRNEGFKTFERYRIYSLISRPAYKSNGKNKWQKLSKISKKNLLDLHETMRVYCPNKEKSNFWNTILWLVRISRIHKIMSKIRQKFLDLYASIYGNSGWSFDGLGSCRFGVPEKKGNFQKHPKYSFQFCSHPVFFMRMI